LGKREEMDEMRRAAEATVRGGAALLDLVYVEDETWDKVGERLGMDKRTAQRLEQRIIERLRVLISARRGRE
jgi:hypothetical protein